MNDYYNSMEDKLKAEIKSWLFQLYNPDRVYITGTGICECRGMLIMEDKHTMFVDCRDGKGFQWMDIKYLKLILKKYNADNGLTDPVERITKIIRTGCHEMIYYTDKSSLSSFILIDPIEMDFAILEVE